MTANQIMIPVALIFLAIWVTYLALRGKRLARQTAQRNHKPNAPETGHDKAEIARSAMSGMMGRDR
jgi:hypothetical protein